MLGWRRVGRRTHGEWIFGYEGCKVMFQKFKTLRSALRTVFLELVLEVAGLSGDGSAPQRGRGTLELVQQRQQAAELASLYQLGTLPQQLAGFLLKLLVQVGGEFGPAQLYQLLQHSGVKRGLCRAGVGNG